MGREAWKSSRKESLLPLLMQLAQESLSQARAMEMTLHSLSGSGMSGAVIRFRAREHSSGVSKASVLGSPAAELSEEAEVLGL